ncbi:MAG: MFS transporter [Rhodobiaceae bacterium]|nr:MFS transporter [Rhodobiaceae bacterium]
MTDATLAMSGTKKLGVRTYLGYGVGDAGVNFFFQSALTFLLVFYTDVFGISPAAAASVFLVARVVDAVTDPMMGVIADRTRTRWGKFRPYLIIGGVPLALIAVATFSVPDFDDTTKIVYAHITYILFGIAYTVVSIPYSGLTAVVTEDGQERTVLTSYRMAFAMVGGVCVSAATWPLVDFFGGGAIGFQITIGIYGFVAVLLLAWTFGATKETLVSTSSKPPTLSESLGVLSGNKPLWLIIIAFWMGMMAFTIRSSAIIFYFKYNLGREDLIAMFMLALGLGHLVGVIATPFISKRIGKKGTYFWGAVLGILSGVALYLTPYDALPTIFAISILGGFFFAFPTVMGWAMLPDTIEYAEWKRGARADGAIYAAASFFQKLAMAVGGALAGITLSVTGYVANEVQSAEALEGILLMVSLAPALAMSIGIFAIWFYQLDDETHATIRAELDERRSSAR